ncbi:MAG: LLM class flavin-dependent oxidoreductase [Armatimonadota bacterium]|nr:LLM class flavin-dependent oxidoreductase [Armatimonadota bacterium]
MRFSLLILGEHPPQPLAGLVRQAEAAGCDIFWYADEKFYRDPFVGLTLAAQASTRIRLGTGVTEPYARHPALLAMAVASLDEVAGGRAVLGIGAGGSGFPPMGVERRSPARAIPEAVAIIRGLLRGETVEFSGRVFSFRRGRLNFPARPGIPIYVAARGRAMLRAAGAVADGVIIAPYASPRGLRFAIDRVAEGAAGSGRALQELDLVARVDVCIAADRAAARQAVRSAVALPMWISYPNLSYLDPLGLPPPPEDLVAVLARRDYALISQAAALVPDAYLDHLAVAGTLEDVVAQLDQIRRAGIAHITLRPVPPPGGTVQGVVEALARDVMPRFGAEAPAERRR